MHETDKESERWRIEELVDRQREKWHVDPKPPGFNRRTNLDWFEIACKLADIQSDYDHCREVYSRHLVQRALMVIWPVLMPYPWPQSERPSRAEIKVAREQITPLLWAISLMAGRQGFASKHFDFPRITIRRRSKAERMKTSVEKDTRWARESGDEVIGRAVIREYRKHPLDRRSLDSAFIEVAGLGEIESVPTNTVRSVASRYHSYRRLAFERGYADSRAISCEWDGKPWPEDQVWLEDFPSTI